MKQWHQLYQHQHQHQHPQQKQQQQQQLPAGPHRTEEG